MCGFTSLSTELPIILHETAGNANLDPAKGLTRHKGINKEITELVTAAGTEPLWLVAWSKVQKQQQKESPEQRMRKTGLGRAILSSHHIMAFTASSFKPSSHRRVKVHGTDR